MALINCSTLSALFRAPTLGAFVSEPLCVEVVQIEHLPGFRRRAPVPAFFLFLDKKSLKTFESTKIDIK